MKPQKGYAGIVGGGKGRIGCWSTPDDIGDNAFQFDIFTTRMAALARYDRVVPVLITPIEKPAKKRAGKGGKSRV